MLSFVTHVGVGIWLVPYLVGHLGTAAYGLIPIAGMLTQYVGLISQSISSAVSRFLTIALQQDDSNEANRIFSTAFISYLGIGLLQVPLFALVISFADVIIEIPQQLYNDAIALLVCSAAAYVINLVTSVFGVPTYANNRLDIARSIDIGRYVLRLVGILALFVFMGPALRYVGYVDLGIAIIICPVQIAIAKRLAPALRLRVRHFDWSKIRQLTGMGSWLLVNNVGTLLFLRMDVWVCNQFIGPEAAGEYAAILQWPTLIRHGGAIIAAVVAPMVVIYYARSEMEQLIRLSKVSVRLLSLLLTVPIAIICVFSSSLLGLWLGESFRHLAPLMVIMLCHLASNVGIIPLFNIQVAMNRVRIPALVTLVMGALNVLLAIIVVRFADWGMNGVAISGAVVLTAKNALWTPLYAAKILNVRWDTFMRPYASSVALLIALLTAGHFASRYFTPTSWLDLVLLSTGFGIVGMVAVLLLLPRSDRRTIMNMAAGRFSKAFTPKSSGNVA